jgi:hypothetical protein
MLVTYPRCLGMFFLRFLIAIPFILSRYCLSTRCALWLVTLLLLLELLHALLARVSLDIVTIALDGVVIPEPP